MPIEIIVTIVSFVLTGIGALFMRWINSTERKLEELNKELNEIKPTLKIIKEAVEEHEQKLSQLITKQIHDGEKLIHLSQNINREYYRITALETSLSELKKSIQKYPSANDSNDMNSNPIKEQIYVKR